MHYPLSFVYFASDSVGDYWTALWEHMLWYINLRFPNHYTYGKSPRKPWICFTVFWITLNFSLFIQMPIWSSSPWYFTILELAARFRGTHSKQFRAAIPQGWKTFFWRFGVGGRKKWHELSSYSSYIVAHTSTRLRGWGNKETKHGHFIYNHINIQVKNNLFWFLSGLNTSIFPIFPRSN